MSPSEWRTQDLPRSLMVIAPHPDDEILGCGRLMQRVVENGGLVAVVWMTDGGASHGALNPDERSRLTARRQREAREGLKILGVEPAAQIFLAYPDGGLAAQDPDELAMRICNLCSDLATDTIVVTDRDDGHVDHRAAFDLVAGVTGLKVFSYPVSARYDGEAYSPPPGARIIPSDGGDRKRAALECHRSQQAINGARYPLSEATIERFCGEPEIFIPVRRNG